MTAEAEAWSRDAHNGTEAGSGEPDDEPYQVSGGCDSKAMTRRQGH